MQNLLSLFFLILVQSTCAQDDNKLNVSFVPYFDESPILISTENEEINSELMNVEVLRFYISSVSLYKNEECLFTDDSFHLVDAEISNSLSWTLSPPSFDFTHIQFNIGVDSLTNATGVQGGDLDPMHGMYWAWQSGYINFKLEGTSPKFPARKNRFQYHIGGFLSPYNAIQTVRLPISKGNDISIKVDLDVLFNNIDIGETYEIMSPSDKSVEISQIIKEMFSTL